MSMCVITSHSPEEISSHPLLSKIQVAQDHLFAVYKEWQECEQKWMVELVCLFGEDACNVRYQTPNEKWSEQAKQLRDEFTRLQDLHRDAMCNFLQARDVAEVEQFLCCKHGEKVHYEVYRLGVSRRR